VNVVVGVTGSIAAYKAAGLVTGLVGRGHDVRVVMTENARRFVGPETFRSLSGNAVITSLWVPEERFSTLHVELAGWADVIAIVPATANVIGKLACGILDDVLTCTVYAAGCPVLLAPAMNMGMWEHPVVETNCRKLRELGYELIEPETGRLATGALGKGRLADVAKIADAIQDILDSRKPEG